MYVLKYIVNVCPTKPISFIYYECDRCLVKCKQNSTLRRYKQAVHEGVMFQCGQCKFKAFHICDLKKHTKAVHEGNSDCNQHGNISMKTNNMKYHIMPAHGKGRVQYNDCEKPFNKAGDLKKHKKKHVRACEKSLTQGGQLNRHMRIHLGINPYPCNRTCNQHQKTDSREKRYACPECKVMINENQKLRYPMLIHTRKDMAIFTIRSEFTLSLAGNFSMATSARGLSEVGYIPPLLKSQHQSFFGHASSNISEVICFYDNLLFLKPCWPRSVSGIAATEWRVLV